MRPYTKLHTRARARAHTHTHINQPDKRSREWLKVKKDYIEGMTDSFDLVVVGPYPDVS